MLRGASKEQERSPDRRRERAPGGYVLKGKFGRLYVWQENDILKYRHSIVTTKRSCLLQYVKS